MADESQIDTGKSRLFLPLGGILIALAFLLGDIGVLLYAMGISNSIHKAAKDENQKSSLDFPLRNTTTYTAVVREYQFEVGTTDRRTS